MSHRSGARFGPRAIREGQYTGGSINALEAGVRPLEVLTVVDAGAAHIVSGVVGRGHAKIYRKARDVAATGANQITVGLLTGELPRGIGRIVEAVELAGMDIVGVSPPYRRAEVTALAADQCVLAALTALARRRRAGLAIRWEA